MPIRSEKQRRWMHANEPEMAREWERHTPKKDLPMRAKAEQPFAGGFTLAETKRAAKAAKIDLAQEEFSLEQLQTGMNHEREHGDVSKAAKVILKIAVAHLREDADYYRKLSRIEKGEVVEVFKKGAPLPYLVKAGQGFSPGMALQGHGHGAGPLFNTPEMPDFAYIYNMPEGDPRKDDEPEDQANRRRAARRGAREVLDGAHGKAPKPELRAEDEEIPTLIVKRRQPATVDRERIYAKMRLYFDLGE